MIVWAGSGTLVAWWIEKINRFGQGLCFRANQTGVGWGGRLPLSDEEWFKRDDSFHHVHYQSMWQR